ncbi:MAG: hypothetical protein G9473_11425 [Erythrobacter sp.]|nr:MAG: hypothetical protein G9473_11425 [Erythrobacter sp.]
MAEWTYGELASAMLFGAIVGAGVRLAWHAWRDRRALAERFAPGRFDPPEFEIAPVTADERARLWETTAWFALLGMVGGAFVTIDDPRLFSVIWALGPIVLIVYIHLGRPLPGDAEAIREFVEAHGTEPTTRHLTQPHWQALAILAALVAAWAGGLFEGLFAWFPGWLFAMLAFALIGYFTTSVLRAERDLFRREG